MIPTANASPLNNNAVDCLIRNPIEQLPRTLRQDMEYFGALLTEEWDDDLSKTLRLWHKNCTQSLKLRTINHKEVLNLFLDQLTRILVVPGTQIPLDEEAVLGSDRHVYGKKMLCLHRHHTPAPYNTRSPLNPEDPRPFMVRPHEPVRWIVSWIKRYPRSFESPEINRQFNLLPPENKTLPEVSAKIQKIRLDQFARKQQHAQNQNHDADVIAKLNELVDRVVVPQVAAIQADVAQHHVEAHARLDRVEHNFREEEQAIRQQFQQVDTDIQVITRDLDRLRVETNGVKGQIEEAKQDNIKLQIAIKETEKAIKDSQKGGLGAILGVVLAIGACWLGCWAATEAFKALGMAAKPMLSTVPGGLKGGLSFTF